MIKVYIVFTALDSSSNDVCLLTGVINREDHEDFHMLPYVLVRDTDDDDQIKQQANELAKTLFDTKRDLLIRATIVRMTLWNEVLLVCSSSSASKRIICNDKNEPWIEEFNKKHGMGKHTESSRDVIPFPKHTAKCLVLINAICCFLSHKTYLMTNMWLIYAFANFINFMAHEETGSPAGKSTISHLYNVARLQWVKLDACMQVNCQKSMKRVVCAEKHVLEQPFKALKRIFTTK